MAIKIFDARPLIERGHKPFDRIMEAWDSLAGGDTLRLIAPFEPKPLAAMFTLQNVPVFVHCIGPDEFHLVAGPKPC